MPKITLPVPYKVTARNLKTKVQKDEKFPACGVAEFEIAEYDHRDVLVVGEWQQRWGKENVIDQPPAFTAEPGEIKKRFQAKPSLSQVVLIDGILYSPVKVSHPEGGGVHLLTFENLASAFHVGYQMWSVSGHALSYFNDNSSYHRTLKDSEFGSNGGRPVSAKLKGRSRVDDNQFHMENNMIMELDRLAVIDGMIWAVVEEPIITLRHDGQKATLLLEAEANRYGSSESQLFFSLCDYELARSFAEAHYGDKELILDIDNVRIDLPDALRGSREYYESKNALDYFIKVAGNHAKAFSRETGRIWFAARDLVAANPELTPETLDTLTEMIEALLERLPATPMEDKDRVSLMRHGTMAVDRWKFRPLDVTRSLGV